MTALPEPIINYLSQLMAERHTPAYLKISRQGLLLECGGALQHYQLDQLIIDQPIAPELPILAGMLPLDGTPIYLAALKLHPDCSADIHIFSVNDVDWVLLLDVTAHEQRFGLMQQKVNDLNLLRERQSRLLNRALDPAINNRVIDQFNFAEQGEYKLVAILVMTIKGLADEASDPIAVISSLSQFLPVLMQIITDEAGLCERLIGNRLMAVFGALPSAETPARLAIKAGARVLIELPQLNQNYQLGFGITAGSAIIGLAGSREHQLISVVGAVVDIAAQLADQAAKNQLLIDQATLSQAEDLIKSYQLTTSPLTLGDYPLPIICCEKKW